MGTKALSPLLIADRIMQVGPQHSAILPSEMMLFCAVALGQRVDTVIESGRRYGYSTAVLSQFDWNVISLDNNPDPATDERLAAMYPHLRMINGNGLSDVDRLIRGRTAVLLDGPKGLPALDVFRRIQNRIVMCGIHDVYPGTPIRDAVQEFDPTFSDNESWLESHGWMDMDTLAYRGYSAHSDLLGVANVLAILPGGKYETCNSVSEAAVGNQDVPSETRGDSSHPPANGECTDGTGLAGVE